MNDSFMTSSAVNDSFMTSGPAVSAARGPAKSPRRARPELQTAAGAVQVKDPFTSPDVMNDPFMTSRARAAR